MEIDPRLCPPSNGAVDGSGTGESTTAHSYDPSPPSGQAVTSASSAHTASDYPDIPSHFSPVGPLHSAASSSGHSYYGAPSQSTHNTIYHGDPSPVAGTHRVEPTDPNDPFAELKRPRACEACRQLKVRCEPDDSHPNGSCKRCAKAGRACVVTVPTRKRQRKTDSRVAELERKIDALTASLHASQGHEGTPQAGQVGGSHRDEHVGRRWLGGGQSQRPSNGSASLAGNKRRYSGELKDSNGVYLAPMYPRAGSPSTEQMHDHTSSKQWRGPWSRSDAAARPDSVHEFADAIDKGVVNVEEAARAFDRYVNELAPQMPIVVFPPGTQMGDVRRTKPMLFHAILSVSIGPIKPSVHLPLVNDFYRMLAERVVVKGEKSLELVQAIMVSCAWYTPPDHFEELKFYQLTHMAVLMGMDMGMNRRTMANRKHFNLMREIMGKKPSALNPDAPETRRTWLGCYFLSVQVSTSWRRVLLVRWQPYMDECIEILERSPDALPTDKVLIHWAKLAHLTEEVSFQFSVDDPSSFLSLSDPKVQYTLKVFEKQLDQWRKDIPPEFYSPILRQFENILNVYMHEIAMHADYNGDGLKSPATGEEDHSCPATAAQISALTACLTSIHQTLDIISSIDIKQISCLPTVALARTSYAAVALIKLYSLVSAPDSGIGQVIDPASLRVEYYLDKVIEHYKSAGERDGGRTPAKFSVVLTMLRNWFHKRKEQDPSLREAFAGLIKAEGAPATEADRHNQHPPGATPLQLLSEVAMGGPDRRSGSAPGQFHRYSQQPAELVSSATAPSDLVPPPPSSIGPGITTGSAESDQPWGVQYPAVPGLPPRAPGTTPGLYPPPYSQQQATPMQELSSAYANPNGNHLLTSNGVQTGFVPELGMQVVDPENLFALGSMLDDGFFNWPISMDGTGFYG